MTFLGDTKVVLIAEFYRISLEIMQMHGHAGNPAINYMYHSLPKAQIRRMRERTSKNSSVSKLERTKRGRIANEKKNWTVSNKKKCLGIYLAIRASNIIFILWDCSKHKHKLSLRMTKQKNGMCAQRRLRSADASTHADQSLCCALNG